MSEWKTGPLTELAFYQNGYAFKPIDWQKEGLPIIRIEQINNPNASFDYFEGIIPAENHIDNGDIIFSWSATFKAVIWRKGRAVLNQHLFKVVPKPGFDKGFVFYILEYNMPKLEESAHGSTMRHIRRGELDRYTVTFPRREYEQRKIARILATVDAVIEKTEAAIAKYKAIKQGMMRDLFTRGLDANNHLRPGYEDAPYLYKQAELGWVPKEWEVLQVNDIAVHVGSGVTPTGGSNVYKTEGTLFIRSQNVHFDGLHLEDIAFIDKDTHDVMERSKVLPFDVLLNITGASIGRCCYFPVELHEANVNQHVCIIRIPKASIEKARYISTFLSSSFGQNQIDRLNAGGNREGLNYQQLRAFYIPWPKSEIEMSRVSLSIASINRVLAREYSTFSKLTTLKQGLMSDLLTGKKRVTADTIM